MKLAALLNSLTPVEEHMGLFSEITQTEVEYETQSLKNSKDLRYFFLIITFLQPLRTAITIIQEPNTKIYIFPGTNI